MRETNLTISLSHPESLQLFHAFVTAQLNAGEIRQHTLNLVWDKARELKIHPSDAKQIINRLLSPIGRGLAINQAPLYQIVVRENVSRNIAFRFVLASIIGGFVGQFLGYWLSTTAIIQSAGITGWAITGCCLGLGMGSFQWLLLRSLVPIRFRWVILSGIGASIGNLIGFLLGESITWTLFGSAIGAFGITGFALGVVIGFAQWIELRHYVDKITIWSIATGVCWSFGNMLGILNNGERWGLGSLTGWIIALLISVSTQAILLYLLLRTRVSN